MRLTWPPNCALIRKNWSDFPGTAAGQLDINEWGQGPDQVGGHGLVASDGGRVCPPFTVYIRSRSISGTADAATRGAVGNVDAVEKLRIREDVCRAARRGIRKAAIRDDAESGAVVIISEVLTEDAIPRRWPGIGASTLSRSAKFPVRVQFTRLCPCRLRRRLPPSTMLTRQLCRVAG